MASTGAINDFFEGAFTPVGQTWTPIKGGAILNGTGPGQYTKYTTDPRLDPNNPMGQIAAKAGAQYGVSPDKLTKAQYDSYLNQFMEEQYAQKGTAFHSFLDFLPKAVALIGGGAALAGAGAAGAVGEGASLGGYGGLEAYGGSGAMGGITGLGAGGTSLAEGGLASLGGAATDLGGGILGATGEYVTPSLVGGTADTFAGVDGTGFLGNGVSSGPTLGTTEGITQGATVAQGTVPAATGGSTLGDLYNTYQNSPLGQLPPGTTTVGSQLLDSSGGTDVSGLTDESGFQGNGVSSGPTAGTTDGITQGSTVTQGTTSGGTGVATAASTAGKWSRIFDGTATADDWASVLGTVGSTGLGVLGADAKSSALTDIFNKQRADRAPSLSAFNTALTNPDAFYASAPAMGATDAVLRKLSVGGNPAANPGDLSKAAAYNLGGFNDYLRTLSGPAFGGEAVNAATGTAAANANGGVYDALGYGLGSATAPDSTLQSLLKQFTLNTGKSLV